MLMFIIYGSNTIYFSPVPDHPAYDILQIGMDETEQGQKNPSRRSSIAFTDLLQKGDVERGHNLFSQCAICHTAFENEQNRIGPNLWHVIGRPAAFLSSFNYSKAMRDFSKKGYIWDFTTLDSYLHAPARVVPGTIMSFTGVQNEQDRVDLLRYLNTLSESPMIFPGKEE